MKTLKSFFHSPLVVVERSCSDTQSLTRTFIMTGDERCPIAGIWSSIVQNDATAEDPESKRPAMGLFLLWRAFIFM